MRVVRIKHPQVWYEIEVPCIIVPSFKFTVLHKHEYIGHELKYSERPFVLYPFNSDSSYMIIIREGGVGNNYYRWMLCMERFSLVTDSGPVVRLPCK